MARVTLHPQCAADLQQSVLWYETRGAGLGIQLMQELRHHLSYLQSYPRAGRMDYDLHRELPLKRFLYVVVYLDFAEELLIKAIFHTSRNPNSKLR